MTVSTASPTGSTVATTPSDRQQGRRMLHIILIGLWLLIAVVPLTVGIRYYLTPVVDRAYAPLHELFKPSGPVGHSMGMLGSLMMIAGVAMYSFRKRVSAMRAVGRLRGWLDVHIFLCTLGPFLVMLHTSFRIGGLVSISFWSMVTVVASGVVGRYVYVRIPKTINGQFVSREYIGNEKEELTARISRDAGLPTACVISILSAFESGQAGSALRLLWQSLLRDFATRSRKRRLARLLLDEGVARALLPRLVEEMEAHIYLHYQFATMQTFRRLFGYWHVFHLPLAILMFVIMFIHIAISAAFGYAWVL